MRMAKIVGNAKSLIEMKYSDFNDTL